MSAITAGPPSPVSTVVGVVLVDSLLRPSRVFAARRTGPPALAGRWEFPGGKVQPGETVVEAAHREIAEELGITIDIGAELVDPDRAAGDWPISPGLTLRLIFATADAEPASVDGSHDQFRWLDLDTIFEVPWLTTDLAAVEVLRGTLRSGLPVGPTGGDDAPRRRPDPNS